MISPNNSLRNLENILEKDPNNAEAWRMKGDLLLRQTKFYDASQCYTRSVILDPNYPLAWKGKGLAALFQNNNVDAKQCFDKTLFLSDVDKSEMFLLLSHVFIWNKNNFDKINKFLEKALAIDGSNPKILFAKGILLQIKGVREDALFFLDKVLNFEPDNFVAKLNRNKITKKDHSINQSIDFLIKNFGLKEDDLQSIKKFGDDLLLAFDLSSAADCFDYLLSLQKNSDTLKKRALIYMMKNNSKKAIELISSSLETEPNDTDAWTRKGEILRRQNRIIEAIDSFDNALKTDPTNSEAWRRKGFSQMMRHDNFKNAIECLDKSLQLDPYHPMTLVQKSNFLRRMNASTDDIMSYLDRALEVDPTFILAWQIKSDLYKTANDFESALLCYKNMKKLDPDDVIVWYNEGVLQAKHAEKEFQKGLEFFKKSKLDSALECFDKVLAVDPNDQETLLMKAKILESLNRKDEALDCYKKASQLSPNDFEIQKQNPKS